MKKIVFLLTLTTLYSVNTYSSEKTISAQKRPHSELGNQLRSESENVTKPESNNRELQKVTDAELIDLLTPQLDSGHTYFFKSDNGPKQAESINGVIQLHNQDESITYFEQIPSIHNQLYQKTEVPPSVKKDGSFSKQCFIITGFLIDLTQKK